MRFDGVFYSRLADELQTALVGGRVEKIHRPGKDEFVFGIRGREGGQKLLFSLIPLRARVNLTAEGFENPPEPGMFCMLLRKRLLGAILTGIGQEGLDRLLYFHFSGTDEIGEPAAHTLAAELFGHRPNLILLDEQGVIIEALRRAPLDSARPIWPGYRYEVPVRNQGSGDRDQGSPWVSEKVESYSRLLEEYYGELDRAQRLGQKTASLRQLLEHRIARLRKKMALQRRELEQAENREDLRIHAELILANKARLERDNAAKGSSAYLLENYYDNNRLVSIAVNPALGPGANAQRLFKAYQKAKNAANLLGDFIAQAGEQLAYLESVEELLARAQSQPEIDALRAELETQGYCKAPANQKKRRQKAPAPLEYRTAEGMKILVGRNNLQNDQLSLKTAGANDLWFHAQGYPGSHVILCTEGKTPAEESILQAAKVAVWHSKARGGAAAVDYTPARYIKKPKAAPPGKVIYHAYQTTIASAAPDDIELLQGGDPLGRH